MIDTLRSWKTRLLDRQAKILGLLLLLSSGKGYERARPKPAADKDRRYKVIVWGTELAPLRTAPGQAQHHQQSTHNLRH